MGPPTLPLNCSLTCCDVPSSSHSNVSSKAPSRSDSSCTLMTWDPPTGMTPLSGLKESLDENRLSEGRRLKQASISPLQADEQHGHLRALGWPQPSVRQAAGLCLGVLHRQASLMVSCEQREPAVKNKGLCYPGQPHSWPTLLAALALSCWQRRLKLPGLTDKRSACSWLLHTDKVEVAISYCPHETSQHPAQQLSDCSKVPCALFPTKAMIGGSEPAPKSHC